MDLPSKGSSREDENCSIQENSIDVLNCPVKNIIRGNLKILYTNADGLPNKLNELKVLAQSDKSKPDVIAVTEVKYKNKWKLFDSELKIESYSLYSNDLSGNGRGVALYVKEDVHCNLLGLYVDSKYEDFLVLQMESGVDEKLLLGIFYRSPNNSPESDEEFFLSY